MSSDELKTKALMHLKAAGELFLIPAIVVLCWAIFSDMGVLHPFLVPSPDRVVAAAEDLHRRGELKEHFWVSMTRVGYGYGLSVIVALPAALLFYFKPWLQRFFHGVLEFFRAVPPLSMIPLLILWFGIGEASKLAVIVLATFFPVFLNALGGFNSLDKRWVELSRSLELTFPRHLVNVLFPAALPQIITGLRLGFGFGWRALLGAELFSSAAGLGYLIIDAQEMARIDIVFVGIFSIGFLGLFFDLILRILTNALSVDAEYRNWGIDG